MAKALKPEVEAELLRLGKFDLIVGIPTLNCADTIGFVIGNTAQGLRKFFPKDRCLIIISDGGSTDGTWEAASELKIPYGVERVIATYAGVSGKGSAVKLILEASAFSEVEGVAIVDSDLRSIVPEWIRLLLDPIVEEAGLTTPLYIRHKYDGTITNQLAYPFTQALYGKRIRQPIGGEFGLSKNLVEKLLESPLWENPYTPRFGIDLFITHTALAYNLPVVEALLGVKIHCPKDPSKHLAPMFREVVGSLFSSMMLYEASWRKVKKSEGVRHLKGSFKIDKPEPCQIDKEAPVRIFKDGFVHHRNLYESVLPKDLYYELSRLFKVTVKEFSLSPQSWAKITYTFAASFKHEKIMERRSLLLDALRTCWYGRVGTFIRETSSLDNEAAEEKVLEDAAVFEDLKSYLLEIY